MAARKYSYGNSAIGSMVFGAHKMGRALRTSVRFIFGSFAFGTMNRARSMRCDEISTAVFVNLYLLESAVYEKNQNKSEKIQKKEKTRTANAVKSLSSNSRMNSYAYEQHHCCLANANVIK